MDAEQLNAIKETLIARRDELLGEGTEELPPNREDAASVPDEDTQPLTEMTQVISSRNNMKRARELNGIESALARIENSPDEFGICEECEEPIKPGRIALMPWTKYCVECQDELVDDGRGFRRKTVRDYLK